MILNKPKRGSRHQGAASSRRAGAMPWFLLLLFAILIAPGPYARAQVTGQAGGLVVDVQAASPHFPDSVDFTLRVRGHDASRAELNYRLVGEPTTEGIQTEVDPNASDINLRVKLDLTTHYVPPGAQVVYYWTLTNENGDTTTPEKTFVMSDDRYTWQSLTDAQKRVSVHWYDGDKAFGNSLLATASGALDRLEHDLAARLDRPAGIWVYSSQDELLGALPKNIPEWVGGRPFPELALVLAEIAPDDMASREIKRIVPHELSHLVLYQATRNPYNSPPLWMDEGLAVHNQEAHDPAEETSLEETAAAGTLPPLKALSGSFGADTDTAVASYGQSGSVMDFVLNDSRYGPAKFARTVAAFKQGVTYDDALKAGLGITVDELDKEWRQSVPFKIAAPSSVPAQAAPAAPVSNPPADSGIPLRSLFVLVPLAACAILFVTGALVTLVVLLRRRAAI